MSCILCDLTPGAILTIVYSGKCTNCGCDNFYELKNARYLGIWEDCNGYMEHWFKADPMPCICERKSTGIYGAYCIGTTINEIITHASLHIDR